MGSQLDINSHSAQLSDRITQRCLIGDIGGHYPRTLLMQEAGDRKSGAAKADNNDIFIF